MEDAGTSSDLIECIVGNVPSVRSRLVRLMLKLFVAPRFRKAGESVEALRRIVDELSKYQKIPSGVEVRPTTVGGVVGEWVVPSCDEVDVAQRLILYLHGGAFVTGSVGTHRELAARMALACAARVLTIDYRVAPEHPFPAAMHDAVGAFRSMLAPAGVAPHHIVIGGDSSGGGLALQTLIALRDAGDPMPAAAFFLSPQTDWVHFDGKSLKTRAPQDPLLNLDTCRFTASCYVGSNDPSTALLSPARMDLSGLPPMLIQAGDCDILLSDSIRLAARARECGVEVRIKVWSNLWHAFHTSARFVPEAREALDELGAYVRSHAGEG